MLSGSIHGTGIFDNNKSVLQFQLFPNPTSDIVQLKTENIRNEELTMNIYNVTGELMRTEILKKNQQHINIADLRNGIYMLELNSEKLTGKKKIVIQR